MYEYKQKRLALDEQSLLECLWETFPQAQREQVITHYARAMAAALGNDPVSEQGESHYDENPEA